MNRRRTTIARRLISSSAAALFVRRRYAAVIVYAGIAAVSYALAYLLRFEFSIPAEYTELLVVTLPALLLVRVAAFRLFNLLRERWRFAGGRTVLRLVGAVAAGSVVTWLLNFAAPDLVGRAVPKSVLVLEAILTCFITSGAWLTYRVSVEALRQAHGNGRKPRRVLIIGAGEAGTLLVREMARFPTGYLPVGFVDDDPFMQSASNFGIPVLGRIVDLPQIADRVHAEELIIAVPSAAPDTLRGIVRCCEVTGLPFKVLPGIREVLNGDVTMAQVREVRIEDLLGREPIQLELPELEKDFAGCTILITGGAGSIGSELARQVGLHRPARLVVLDQAETELFFLDMELRRAYPQVEVVPVIADVANPASIRDVFQRFRPSHVFHAAAYKHVPLMETHALEATRNNVIGTWCVAHMAGEFGARKFVLVSTDKAVRPCNVMGATKRLAELLVMELQWRYRLTTFGAVRFGNVLGSAGSVIAVFNRQIAAGEPLTVTHPEMTRFFMTIPEAVQLILQASLLEDLRGRIAMLEMGAPVRIMDLAENLLQLAGPRAAASRIQITGLRPGEKLHEELVAPDEAAVQTAVPRVRMLIPRDWVSSGLVELIQTAGSSTAAETALLQAVRDLLAANGVMLTMPAAAEPPPTIVGRA